MERPLQQPVGGRQLSKLVRRHSGTALCYQDKLIEPSHAQVSAGLLRGPRFTAIALPDGLAFHSPASLYFDVTPIEREYFDMFFFSALKS